MAKKIYNSRFKGFTGDVCVFVMVVNMGSIS